MNMKDMIQRMTDIETKKQQLNEDGMPPMAPEPDRGMPVSMNVSLNASGAEHVQDLINMMKNAGLNDAKPVDQDMMPMRKDIEKFKDIIDGPKDMDDLKPGVQGEPCPKCGKVHIGMSSCNDSIENDEEPVDEWENSPEGSEGDPERRDHQHMTKDLSGGINREKKQYKFAKDGDNPMESIKEDLYALLAEKKAKPDYIDIDGDGDKKEPMKKAVKDKEKKVKEADDGKCPECGKPGKKKLMACASCGCK